MIPSSDRRSKPAALRRVFAAAEEVQRAGWIGHKKNRDLPMPALRRSREVGAGLSASHERLVPAHHFQIGGTRLKTFAFFNPRMASRSNASLAQALVQAPRGQDSLRLLRVRRCSSASICVIPSRWASRSSLCCRASLTSPGRVSAMNATASSGPSSPASSSARDRLSRTGVRRLTLRSVFFKNTHPNRELRKNTLLKCAT